MQRGLRGVWLQGSGKFPCVKDRKTHAMLSAQSSETVFFSVLLGLKKNQTTPRPSEYPPVMGGKMSKRLGGIKRLQIQNLFMAFKQVPRCR